MKQTGALYLLIYYLCQFLFSLRSQQSCKNNGDIFFVTPKVSSVLIASVDIFCCFHISQHSSNKHTYSCICLPLYILWCGDPLSLKSILDIHRHNASMHLHGKVYKSTVGTNKLLFLYYQDADPIYVNCIAASMYPM